ncbi:MULTISPECIES: hypothetical protein [Bizionia]|uniref:DUF4468 domain-containing protein n=1 Tax=Bizionia algoritergicola TaxID=291187 RepID=A0A5D0QK52_9FLAO|nr:MULTISPECIES: hypothetical protein [Bizionia]OBX17735.1 hypothetical protein BAA08_15845 [Bizionia sp. APA-3]TYB69483.1 hypothetical protein ES675_16130 [Bizionia algoritergicola]
MKKIFITLTLLASIITTAQDGYNLPDSNYESIFKNVTQLDSLTARQFANSIVGNSKTNYTFLSAKNRDDSATYYFIQSGLSDSEIQEQKEMGCVQCMTVNFTVYGNRYVFLNVTGSLKDLLPTWNREFLPAATPELIKESFKYREVKNRSTGVDVRLTDEGGVWQIYNWSI